MGAIHQYMHKYDRSPFVTFHEMCIRIDRLEKENQELRMKSVKEGYTQEQLDEIDRNARAFGWEIGHGAIVVAGTVCTSENNPFLSKNWKEEMFPDADILGYMVQFKDGSTSGPYRTRQEAENNDAFKDSDIIVIRKGDPVEPDQTVHTLPES